MAIPANWSMVRLVGFLVDDDGDPVTDYTLTVQSSQTRLQDNTSRRVVFPKPDVLTPAVADGYFWVDVVSDTDTDLSPSGRQHKVTLSKAGAAVQSWFVTVDHAAATQLRFDNVTQVIVGSGGTQRDAVYLTSLQDFSDAPVVGGSGGSVGAAITNAIAAHKAEADPHTQYALDSDLTSKANTSDLTAHSTSTTNPHAVTKEQVGLGNVDNTSDATKQTANDARYIAADKTGAAVGKVVAVASVDGGGNVTGWNLITPAGGGGGGAVSSVAGRTGDVVIGWADLSGLLPTSKLPPLGITDVFPVTNQAARLALTAQRGDIAVQANPAPAKTYALATDDPTQDANWVLLPAIGSVQTVNGQQGAVVLAHTDVGASRVTVGGTYTPALDVDPTAVTAADVGAATPQRALVLSMIGA